MLLGSADDFSADQGRDRDYGGLLGRRGCGAAAAVSGVVSGLQAQVNGVRCCRLLGDFALGFVGGVVDFCLEAFEQTLEEGVGVGAFVLKLVGVGDVTREVGEDDAPREG